MFFSNFSVVLCFIKMYFTTVYKLLKSRSKCFIFEYCTHNLVRGLVPWTRHVSVMFSLQLREDFDCGKEICLGEDNCPHDVATLLKEFFRDLPDPLLCRDLYQAFVQTQSKNPLVTNTFFFQRRDLYERQLGYQRKFWYWLSFPRLMTTSTAVIVWYLESEELYLLCSSQRLINNL